MAVSPTASERKAQKMAPSPHRTTDDSLLSVPAGLAKLLRDQLLAVASEVEDEVRRQVPEYTQVDKALAGKLRTGVIEALTLFVDHIDDPAGPGDTVICTYYELGWSTALAGRSLETFQSALRVGGMHAWRLMGRTAEEQGLDSALVSALGQLALQTIHEVAEAAAAGHADAQLRDSDELARRERQLLELLLREDAAEATAIQALANAARWAVPEQVAVVVFGPGTDGSHKEPFGRPMGTVADFDAHPPRLLVSDQVGAAGVSDTALPLALLGRPVVIGPTVPLAKAAHSLRWATRALHLMERGVLPQQGLLRCADHLPALLLYSDESLLAQIAVRALTPLEAVPEAQRSRLRETLLAWLLGGCNVPATAARMHLHPQTIRYRLRQLEKLFGDKLHDTDTRLELVLALQSGFNVVCPGSDGVGLLDN
ncbi:helix-turn-helix domain-containing protein [Streptomyces sp. CA-249302]|uniref:PucR family transcriptional regulator n=1 Tax=Streptomyces sp. CA-249302 TaxID=3240058 RepID=UPI003D8DAA04